MLVPQNTFLCSQSVAKKISKQPQITFPKIFSNSNSDYLDHWFDQLFKFQLNLLQCASVLVNSPLESCFNCASAIGFFHVKETFVKRNSLPRIKSKKSHIIPTEQQREAAEHYRARAACCCVSWCRQPALGAKQLSPSGIKLATNISPVKHSANWQG